MDDIAVTAGMTPEERAELGAVALRAFVRGRQDPVIKRAAAAGLGAYTEDLDAVVEDLPTALIDLLCDLHHLADSKGIAWDVLETGAARHYDAERYDEPCEHFGSWQLWEDEIRTLHVTVKGEPPQLTLNVYDSSAGDGENTRVFCSHCQRVFQVPDDVEVVYR